VVNITPALKQRLPFRVRFFVSMILPVLLVPPLSACDVPLFLHALEHWPADPYPVTVIHDGPLSPEQRSLIESLEQVAGDPPLPSNVLLEVVDVKAHPGGQLDALFPSLPGPKLPCLVVRFPATARLAERLWAGPLAAAAVRSLADSPARRTVAKRILEGETAVFLLLEGGRKDKDDAAAKLLQDELQRLQRHLKLPEATPSPEDPVTREGPPLRIAFSLIRVARDDPSEKMLVRMLLRSQDDLVDRSDAMVFPVFGRGRALPPLVGCDITRERLEEVGAFLVSPCSCEVKRLRPGLDLLMAVDWDGTPPVGPACRAGPLLVPLGKRDLPAAAPRPSSSPGGDSLSTDPAATFRGTSRRLLLAAVAVSGLLVIATAILAFRSGRRRTRNGAGGMGNGAPAGSPFPIPPAPFHRGGPGVSRSSASRSPSGGLPSGVGGDTLIGDSSLHRRRRRVP